METSQKSQKAPVVAATDALREAKLAAQNTVLSLEKAQTALDCSRSTLDMTQDVLLSQSIRIEATRTYVKLVTAFDRGDSAVKCIELLLDYADNLRDAYAVHASGYHQVAN